MQQLTERLPAQHRPGVSLGITSMQIFDSLHQFSTTGTRLERLPS